MTNPQEEIQQKYVQMQMLSEQINQVQGQLKIIDSKILEIKELNQNLEELKDWKKGKEVLAPIGANTFVKTELKENQEVIIGVGANVMLNKDIQGAKAINQSQIDELTQISEHARKDFAKLAKDQQQLQQDMIFLAQKQQEKKK